MRDAHAMRWMVMVNVMVDLMLDAMVDAMRWMEGCAIGCDGC